MEQPLTVPVEQPLSLGVMSSQDEVRMHHYGDFSVVRFTALVKLTSRDGIFMQTPRYRECFESSLHRRNNAAFVSALQKLL